MGTPPVPAYRKDFFMKIVIAPDSFKGSLTASQVCDIAAHAAREVFPDAAVQKLPLADGGEGTAEALMNVLPGEIRTLQVRGPLGAPVTARYGIVSSTPTVSARETPEHPLPKTKIAIMDMAGASGLTLVPEAERDVFHSNTFGTGEMILDAISQGCRHIYLGLGGSATSDDGMGMAAALGAVFRDENGTPLDPVPASMHRISAVDVSRLDPAVSQVPITVMSDVKNPLLGPEGAVYVYGPQKGIPADRLADMDQAMAHYIDCVESPFQKNPSATRRVPGRPGVSAPGCLLLPAAKFPPASRRCWSFWNSMPAWNLRTWSSPGRGAWISSRPTAKWWPAWRRTAKPTEHLASPWREASRTAPRRCTISEFPG